MGEYDTLYTEIKPSNACTMLDQILGELQSIQGSDYRPSKRESYCVKSHDGDFDYEAYECAKAKSKDQGKPFRKEEWMCKMCMGKSFPHIGKIVDYQVPLKHSLGEDCEGMGKVDLLSVDGDTAWLLELKVPDSTEPPLRAIMEIYTYWRQLGGDDCQWFLNHSKANGVKKLKKAIVIFEKDADASGKYLYQKLKADREPLLELMRDLDVSCFVAQLKQDDPDCDEIVGVKPCKL